jgi:hypothetical protein
VEPKSTEIPNARDAPFKIPASLPPPPRKFISVVSANTKPSRGREDVAAVVVLNVSVIVNGYVTLITALSLKVDELLGVPPVFAYMSWIPSGVSEDAALPFKVHVPIVNGENKSTVICVGPGAGAGAGAGAPL